MTPERKVTFSRIPEVIGRGTSHVRTVDDSVDTEVVVETTVVEEI